jgi:hypothetical protein
MSKIWRWITPVAVAGGLVAGVPAIPAATASTAATSIITINATSPHFPGLRAKDHGKVDGYAIVIYKATGGPNTATVSGKVTTTATDDTATLLAEPFGAKSFSAVGSPVALTPTDGVAGYSFNVTPSLATQYKVQLAGTDTAASGVATVYVTEGGGTSPANTVCSHTRCTFSYRQYTVLPASAYKTEVGKHWYLYLAVGSKRRLPKDFTLSTTAKASRARKVKSGEYVQTFTYYVALRYGASTSWQAVACVKDTESKDGLGLPGHHGCGAKHISRSGIYLG